MSKPVKSGDAPVRAAVVGGTGYAGAELVRILWDHPDVALVSVTSRQYAGLPIADVFPAMACRVPLVCEELSVEALCEKADVVFVALPHKLPMEIVPRFLERGKKVIDLSADFRFREVEKYEAHYQPHTAPHLLREAVYGLSEIYGNQIRQARLVGNPGCYPTSTLLPLIPFARTGWLDWESVVVDSKSGVSGAGRGLELTTQFCEVHEGFKAYKVATHRHTPEMEEILSREVGREVRITFVPHLVPMSRGMLTTVYVGLNSPIPWEEARSVLASFYEGRAFVRVCDGQLMPNTRYVRGTNYCDVGVRVDPASRRMILVSVIDNLVKGAAGQAVQNMNIMFGLAETAGLDTTPLPV